MQFAWASSEEVPDQPAKLETIVLRQAKETKMDVWVRSWESLLHGRLETFVTFTSSWKKKRVYGECIDIYPLFWLILCFIHTTKKKHKPYKLGIWPLQRFKQGLHSPSQHEKYRSIVCFAVATTPLLLLFTKSSPSK